MGKTLRQRPSIAPTHVHRLRRGSFERTVDCPDIEKLRLLHYLYIHIHRRWHASRSSQNLAAIWLVGEPRCLAELAHYVYCVSSPFEFFAIARKY